MTEEHKVYEGAVPLFPAGVHDFKRVLVDSSITEKVIEILGPRGRLLSLSKSGYRKSHPANIVYFNACIFDNNCIQIWHGDIDISKEWNLLKKLSKSVTVTLYLTPEMFRTDLSGHKADIYIIKNSYTVLEMNNGVIDFHLVNAPDYDQNYVKRKNGSYVRRESL